MKLFRLFGYREKLSGEFILKNPYMKLGDFLTINALIIEVMNFFEPSWNSK